MKATVLYGPRKLEVINVDMPKPPFEWVLVRTELTGICGTDKAFYTGTYKLFKTPLIPGHEVVGIVDSGPEDVVGKRVVPEINFSCGNCEYCKSELYTHCPYKKTLGIDFDGGMAEYFVAPLKALHIYSGTPETGIFVEPLAAVLRALSLRPLKPDHRVAVIGTGNLAWLVVQVIKKLYGIKVDLLVKENSTKAKHYKGLVDNIVYIGELLESTYDVVFEASGDPNALNIAIKAAKPRGAIHLKSTPGIAAYVNTTLAVIKEVEVICSRCGTSREFKQAIKILTNGKVEPRLDVVYELENSKEAFEESLKPSYFKVAVRA